MVPGLQLLFALVAQEISVPQDALICFVHWELVSQGYECLGAGDRPVSDETKSELLPPGWNANKELYTLRYRSVFDTAEILLEAIIVESSMIINAMDPKLEQVVDLTLDVADYIDGDNLKNFHRVFRKRYHLEIQNQAGSQTGSTHCDHLQLVDGTWIPLDQILIICPLQVTMTCLCEHVSCLICEEDSFLPSFWELQREGFISQLGNVPLFGSAIGESSVSQLLMRPALGMGLTPFFSVAWSAMSLSNAVFVI
ncbi:hypothetical protein NDU88_001369 [Pleurodeles waltl]|uniref:Proteasome inhibitor PI31 subunit n=1 Tax=Pleurodeles waltl TaxID=8319 RepID=A0AAV7P3Y4_PLEWA|nr:hypothetical protein NDU88_001369 [Pleurodeles waltl]